MVRPSTGRDRESLEELAGPTITFLGWIPDEDLPDLFARCRAYVLPGVEDFCITPVQAQAAGRPVIALGAGGALDTVIEGSTGVFFQDLSAGALAAAVEVFDPDTIDPRTCRANAERFAAEVFRKKLGRLVEECMT